MKKLSSLMLTLCALAFSDRLLAVNFDVIGPCSKTPVYHGAFKTDLDESVGQTTIDIFETYKVPYVGSSVGINNILNTPTGMDAMEVLSDTKMRAYGWCFSVNGVIPDVLPGDAKFSGQNDYLSWFYAYSTYDQGVWTDYCVPSYTIKAPQFCK